MSRSFACPCCLSRVGCGCARTGSSVPAWLAVGWFVLLARPQPSVVRAAVMGSLGIIAVMSAGRRGGPRLLLAATLVLLLADPWLARSWGFALSVAATAGLFFLATRWRDVFARQMPQLVADGLAVALAAQVATIPLSVALAGQVALLSVPANLLAAPAVAPATALGRRRPRWHPWHLWFPSGWYGWRSGRPSGSRSLRTAPRAPRLPPSPGPTATSAGPAPSP